MIAESILAASAAMGGVSIPVVVRLQGTNYEKGFKLGSTPLLLLLATD